MERACRFSLASAMAREGRNEPRGPPMLHLKKTRRDGFYGGQHQKGFAGLASVGKSNQFIPRPRARQNKTLATAAAPNDAGSP